MPLKKTFIILFALLAACRDLPANTTPSANPTSVASPTFAASPTVKPVSDGLPNLPEPYTGSLELIPSDEPATFCEKDTLPLDLPAKGMVRLGFLPNRKCADINSDLDLFEIDDKLYLAQRNGQGFRLVDVTNPFQPNEIGVWQFKPGDHQEHITAFHQFGRYFLATQLESPSPYGKYVCGLAIIEVTQPESPVLLGRYDGTNLKSDVPWCDVHATEVDTDADGNATFLFLSTLNTADLRVLDIRDLNNIREVNVFHQHVHPHGEYGSWSHRAVVTGDRVYISYWGGGVMIVDKHGLEAGLPSDQIMLAQPGGIDPDDYVTHDLQPTHDGNFLFVNDMEEISDGIRLFDIRDLAHPREVWKSSVETEVGQHTMQLHGNLLFVPWFREGLRVFRFDLSNPNQPIIEQAAYQSVRTPPYSSSDGGIGALRVRDCEVGGIAKICIYASDEELGLIILALDEE